MKHLFFFLLSFSLIGICFGQKTINDPNVEVRNASGFHAVEVSGGIDLYLSKGEEVVAVSAKEKSIRDHIHVEVKNGVLKIWYDWKDRFNFSNKNLKAYVS